MISGNMSTIYGFTGGVIVFEEKDDFTWAPLFLLKSQYESANFFVEKTA